MLNSPSCLENRITVPWAVKIINYWNRHTPENLSRKAPLKPHRTPRLKPRKPFSKVLISVADLDLEPDLDP
jgi:hypothetical protein